LFSLKIVDRPGLWDYIESKFIPNIYSSPWYNDKKLNWREKLTISSRYGIRVGAPRIRQLRVKENTCMVHPKVKNIIHHCRDAYNWVDDDTKDFDIGWKKILNDSLTNSSTTTIKEEGVKLRKSRWKCKNAWCYQVSHKKYTYIKFIYVIFVLFSFYIHKNTIQTKTAPFVGNFATYKGGGYAISLGRSVERSNVLIKDLKVN
jgi:hypothetical protein